MDYLKQQDIFNPDDMIWPCNIIGLGGIGSATVLVLAKLGIQEFRLWDDDILEESNLPNQLIYRPSDIGKSKVVAVRNILAEHGISNVSISHEPFTSQFKLDGIVISGVHTMDKDEEGREGRLDIWKSIKYNVDVPLYLDGRLGGEIFELYTVRPSIMEDIELYEKSLFPSSEAAQLPCTARAIVYPAVLLAGHIAAHITRWVRNESYYRKIVFDAKTSTLIQQHLLTPAEGENS